MRVAVAVLAIDHCRGNGIGLRGTMLQVSMARETLNLFTLGMDLVQFNTCGFFVLGVTMAVQAHRFSHLACFFDLAFVTRIIATGLIGNELGVVNRHQPAFDNLVRNFMTIQAGCVNQSRPVFAGFEKMAREAHLFIYAEMFGALKMAVTGATGNCYAVNHLCDMIFVSEFNAAEVNIRRLKLFDAVTF
jgi:hypothetical protein